MCENVRMRGLSCLESEGVIAYIEDILIYTETEEEHVQLIEKVLQWLREAKLGVSIKKSRFHASEIEYWG